MTKPPREPGHPPAAEQGAAARGAGVSIGGGNTFNGPVAAGYQASAVQFGQAGAEAGLAELEELLQQLEQGVRQLGEVPGQSALADIGRVRHEISQHPPDRSRISQLLERIVAVVAPVSGLLEAANQARDLIAAILH